MRTPEEIKEGLERCRNVWCHDHLKTCSGDCPYVAEFYYCKNTMHRDALVYIKQLEAQVPRWIPVEERLPETCKDVLVWAEYHEENGRTWGLQEIDSFYKGVGWENTADPDVRKVTHWMPQYRPPKPMGDDGGNQHPLGGMKL